VRFPNRWQSSHHELLPNALACCISVPDMTADGIWYVLSSVNFLIQLCFSNRSPFYNDLSTEQQAVWDEIRFLRKNADAIAYLARQGSCFRVGLQLITPDALAAASPATAPAAEKQEWRPVYDTTLRFEVRLV